MGVACVQWWLDGHGFERLVSGGGIAMWELLVWSWCLGGHRLNKWKWWLDSHEISMRCV